MLGSALGTLVLVLDQGQTWGWLSISSLTAYVVAAISFIAFILVEQRQKEPVVDLKFFKIPEFAISLLVSFITFMGMIGGLFLLPIFVQSYMGYDVTKTGYLFLPMAAGMLIGAQTGARLSVKFGPKYVVFAGLTWAAFILFLFSGIDLTWSFAHFATLLGLFALGLGLTFAPITNAAISTVPLHEVGVASSLLALVRNISGAFGVAIFATILTNSVTGGILNVQKFSVINTFDPNVLKQAAFLMVIKANVSAFKIVFLCSSAITLIGSFSALLLRETKQEMMGKVEISGEGMM